MLFFPLYLTGFILSLLALIGWFYFQRRTGAASLFRGLVLGGLALYLLGVVFTSAPFDVKLSVLVRDLLIIGGAGLVFQWLVRKQPAFFFGLVALGIVLVWFYKNHLSTTFAETALSDVDPRGELLIELREGADPQTLARLAERYGLRYRPAFTLDHPAATDLDDYYVVDIPDRFAARQAAVARALAGLASVEWVEPNEVITVDPPQETKLPEPIRRRFGINDPGLENLWGFEEMAVDKLYTYLRDRGVSPRKKALVAILDTGVDGKHEDINDNYRSLQGKYDTDSHGHGTHCAGIAAAVSNNGKGVASFSPDNGFVEVAGIKVLSASGSGTQQTIINGMLEAADRGAAVISMSLGGRSSQSSQRAYEKAVQYANRAGAIVVAAAGNSNRNARDFAPVNAAGVIGVSAVDQQLNRAVFSNYITDLERGLAAPGVNIYSTIPADKYATFSGTSMATPYVAGVVGLLKAIDPSLTTSQVYQLLRTTGRDTRATTETGKLIQPHLAVQRLVEGG